MNYHLIVGYGKWSKKNLKYLKNKNFFKEIIIKDRKNYFFFDSKIKINNFVKSEIFKKIKSVHICTPINNHFKDLKKYKFFKKTIVEKPFVKNIKELSKIKKIYQNKFFRVNYIDTFSPLIKKINTSINKKNFFQVNLNYSKKNKFYKYKNEFALEWLDHPLSLILFFFKKFPRFNIEKSLIIKKNDMYNQQIIINYFFRNHKVNINLNCSSKVERNFQILRKKNTETFHFYKNIIFLNKKKTFQSKKNAFDIFYKTLKNNQKNSTQNFNFHKKIIMERNKILNKLNKNNS